ncbi:MAG: alpha/beta hydrolase [Alphaproteobacteria bacterium]|nr:alpha/beta hydrolase [Alphaproteobacteria bacterium]
MVSQPILPLVLILAGLLAAPCSASPKVATLARADGSLIHYTLDRPSGRPEGLMLLSQGSGCAPGATNASIATVRAAFPRYAALVVEKIGVTPDAAITHGYTDCPDAFVQRYTVSQRIEDYRAVLSQLQLDPDLAADHLLLFGGSEGGLAVAMLAAELNPVATIILSSAAGTPFGEMVRSTVPPEGHPTIDAGFAAARANPDSAELFAGSTYRFWADIVDVKAVDFMLQTSSPFLLIQGDLDTSSPVASARLTADAFAAEGRCTLTYWEFPTLDHSMKMPDGSSRMAEIAAMAARWVKKPSPAC